jgi:hypothetical protein
MFAGLCDCVAKLASPAAEHSRGDAFWNASDLAAECSDIGRTARHEATDPDTAAALLHVADALDSLCLVVRTLCLRVGALEARDAAPEPEMPTPKPSVEEIYDKILAKFSEFEEIKVLAADLAAHPDAPDPEPPPVLTAQPDEWAEQAALREQLDPGRNDLTMHVSPGPSGEDYGNTAEFRALKSWGYLREMVLAAAPDSQPVPVLLAFSDLSPCMDVYRVRSGELERFQAAEEKAAGGDRTTT